MSFNHLRILMIFALIFSWASHSSVSAEIVTKKKQPENKPKTLSQKMLSQKITFGIAKGLAADSAARSFAYYAPNLVNTEVLQINSFPPEFSKATSEVAKTRLTLREALDLLGRTYPELTWREDGACINLTLNTDPAATNFLDRRVPVTAELELSAEEWVKWLRAQDEGSGLRYEPPFSEDLAVYAPTKKVKLRVNPTMTLCHVLNLLSQSLDSQWVAVMKRQLDIAPIDATGHRHPIAYNSTTVTFSLIETPTTSLKYHEKRQ